MPGAQSDLSREPDRSRQPLYRSGVAAAAPTVALPAALSSTSQAAAAADVSAESNQIDSALSEYEKTRLDKIAMNAKELGELGLLPLPRQQQKSVGGISRKRAKPQRRGSRRRCQTACILVMFMCT